MIRAPFNFVPLAEKVYLPDWADKISQDVPFSDGVSGCIDLTITAMSPIFIRNGHTKEEAEIGKEAAFNAFENRNNPQLMEEAMQMPYNQFCNVGGHSFIPSTSIKGEVRNILEILSFSRMRVDINAKFAQREWYTINRDTPKAFKEWYEKLYPIRTNQSQLSCGYLRRIKNTEDFEITDCGHPYRIGLDMIDLYLATEYQRNDVFKSHFSISDHHEFNINNEITIDGEKYDPKTARFKYHLAGNAKLRDLHFSEVDTSTKYSTRLKVSNAGSIKGDIVFTGQPGYCMWNRPTTLRPDAGKFYEFVFGEEQNAPTPISELDFMHFKFIYAESDEWSKVKEELETSKGVPVFFRKVKGKIKDFGLAYLYKLPYEQSPYDILTKMYEGQEKSKDLAQCILGDVEHRKHGLDEAMKGRVFFSNAFCNNAQTYRNQDGFYGLRLVLNSPKASYYPIYIQQNGNRQILSGEYKTYNDGSLSGWKRYLVRQNDHIWENCTNSRKTDTILFPLQAGTVFNGKIRFNNLKPIELGALLSALTFHNTSDCYHQLGQGKPYGLGKTKYNIALHCDKQGTPEYYMALFEEAMNRKTGNWINSSTISSLITMAKTEVSVDDVIYKYMTLQVNPNKNEFADAKLAKEFLEDFRTMQGRSYSPKSLLSHIAVQRQRELELQEEESKKMKENAISLRRSEFETAIARINELIANHELSQALAVIDTIRETTCKTNELINQDDVEKWLNILQEKESEIQNKKRKEGGLAAHLSGINKIGTLQGKIKSWIKTVSQTEGRSVLTDSEQAIVLQAFLSLPQKELKTASDRKKKVWVELENQLGADYVDILFNELFK